MIGESAALIAAGIWAISSLMYDRIFGAVKISGTLLSCYRGLVSLPFFVISLWGVGASFPQLTTVQWVDLGLSAILGITIGDTAFFLSLRDLGLRKALLLQTLTPLFGAFFAGLFLQEKISPWGLWGIPLTLLGLAWVISERTAVSDFTGNLPRGIFWGILSCGTQGLGAMFLKEVLNNSDLTSLWSSTLRLGFGTLILVLWLWAKQQLFFSILSRLQWQQLTGAAFGGTFIGLWLHQTAFQLAPVGIAATLLNTSPLFALGVSAYLREKISLRAILGAALTLVGIGFLFIPGG